MHGMTFTDDNGCDLPALKATTFLTDMPAAKVFLNRTCQGGHRHCPLAGSIPGKGGRTELAQVYAGGLVRAILRAIQLQAQWDEKSLCLFGTVMEGQVPNKSKPTPREEEDDESLTAEAWDDISGETLDSKAVSDSRREEINYYHQMDAFEVVPRHAAIERSGKNPVGGRWIGISKGDKARPLIRRRLLAEDFKLYKDYDLYAGPPLECLKFIVSNATTGEQPNATMVNDISRACPHADCHSEIFAETCLRIAMGSEV